MGGAIEIQPPATWAFFAVALLLTGLLAVAEVVAAFRDTTYSSWRSLANPWSVVLYAFHIALTFLLGIVLFENDLLPRTWTAAVALGLAGPALFRTKVTLFQPISGAGGPAVNLEKLISGVQSFCFDQINRRLARKRMAKKEQAARQGESRLVERLRALSSPEGFETLSELIDERRKAEPESVRAFLVALIEDRDPGALDEPFADQSVKDSSAVDQD